jgi:septal ring factor EnvC (AmiA/AmiB activator)
VPVGVTTYLFLAGVANLALAAIFQTAPWLPSGSIETWGAITFLAIGIFAFWRGLIEPGSRSKELRETIGILNGELKEQSEAYTRLAEQRAEDRAEKEYLNRQLGQLTGQVESGNREIRQLEGRISQLLSERERINRERDEAMRRMSEFMDSHREAAREQPEGG